jgi:uncharacterized protein DUF6580
MIYALILLAAACRLAPHPPNFTPVLAVALFGGAMLPRRVGWAVPLLALVASDAALGYRFSWMNAVVYGSFLAAVGIGGWLRQRRTWGRTLAAALAGSVLFYMVTNFAVWLAPPFMYEHTAAGLVRCYVAALPFFRNSLAGDLFWAAALFGLHDLARAWVRARRPGMESARP